MAEFPALPLFTDAYMADTRHLTTTQHGAYLLLLMTAWRTPDCKLPDDDVLLARWAGMDFRNWKKMRPIIIDQFWKKDAAGKLQQCRLLEERIYADSRRRQNAEAGKASALKRKERHSTSVPTEQQRKSNPLTLPLLKKEKIIIKIPEWMPIEDWNDYLEMRIKSRKPASDAAMKMAIKKLEKLKSDGHSPVECLQQSTLKNYTDIYPPAKQSGMNFPSNLPVKSNVRTI